MTKNEKKTSVGPTAIGSRFFNVRLFFEGVKRLKIIAIGALILALTASILIPVISWINYANQYERDCWNEEPVYDDAGNVIDIQMVYVEKEIVPHKVEPYLLCLPLYVLPFTAPFFFFVLFSFLHKRKQSDFFHAIPYTRTCVFVSFTAAALASVAAIAVLSSLLSGVIYAACPFTTFAIGELLSVLGVSILSAAFLSSFMMLSLSLTGTPSTSLLLFGLFALITRVVLALFSFAVDNFTIVRASFYPFLSMYWYLPFRMFIQNTSYTEGIPPYAHLVPYTIVVTLALFAAAGLFYKLRRSEMAERSAPSRRLQSIFRCLFTLPFALLLTTMVMIDEIDFDVALVLFVITLLVYFLYELITTKRLRNLPRATPWLGAVVGGAVVFVLSFSVFGAAVHADIPEEKIESVSITPVYSSTYESLKTGSIPSSDERVIDLVSYALDYTRNMNNNNYSDNGRLSYRTVTIRKTNGMTVKRGLYFTEENEALLEGYLTESEEYVESYLELPPIESIRNMQFFPEGVSSYDSLYLSSGTERFEEFYAVLKSGYDKLSKEEKLDFKRGDRAMIPKDETVKPLPDYVYDEKYHSTFYAQLTVNGTVNGNSYSSYYVLPGSMNGLISYAFTELAEQNRTCHYRSEYLYETYGIESLSSEDGAHTPLEITSAIYRDFTGGHISFDEGYVRIAAYEQNEYTLAVAKEGADFRAFLERITTCLAENAEPKAGTIPVSLITEFFNYDISIDQAYSTIILHLTEEEYKELLTSIGMEDK